MHFSGFSGNRSIIRGALKGGVFKMVKSRQNGVIEWSKRSKVSERRAIKRGFLTVLTVLTLRLVVLTVLTLFSRNGL